MLTMAMSLTMMMTMEITLTINTCFFNQITNKSNATFTA